MVRLSSGEIVSGCCVSESSEETRPADSGFRKAYQTAAFSYFFNSSRRLNAASTTSRRNPPRFATKGILIHPEAALLSPDR